MTDLRKAAEMALAKLDYLWEIAVDKRMNTDVLPEIKALRQALAQPEQEPAAWINKDGCFRSPKDADAAFRAYAFPLYAAPLKREWVGLTDNEVYEFVCTTDSYINLVKAIEAKLKEKNT